MEMPNTDIPASVIRELHQLQAVGLTLEDAVTKIRGNLVPAGYEPYPFRINTEKSLLDKLRSIVATYTFRKSVEELKDKGSDFSHHLYVPEIDPITGNDDDDDCDNDNWGH